MEHNDLFPDAEMVDDTNIRPPDDIYAERLIDNCGDLDLDFEDNDTELVRVLCNSVESMDADDISRNMMALSEKELEKILEKSRLEYESQIQAELERVRERECEERRTRFGNAKSQIQRLHRVDKYDTDIYGILLDGICVYEHDGVRQFPVNDITVFERIERIVKTLRISSQEREDILFYFSPFTVVNRGISLTNRDG